jgi:hypothetical protein
MPDCTCTVRTVPVQERCGTEDAIFNHTLQQYTSQTANEWCRLGTYSTGVSAVTCTVLMVPWFFEDHTLLASITTFQPVFLVLWNSLFHQSMHEPVHSFNNGKWKWFRIGLVQRYCSLRTIVASIVGGGSKLAIQKSWLVQHEEEEEESFRGVFRDNDQSLTSHICYERHANVNPLASPIDSSDNNPSRWYQRGKREKQHRLKTPFVVGWERLFPLGDNHVFHLGPHKECLRSDVQYNEENVSQEGYIYLFSTQGVASCWWTPC